jgi:HrpA-like RNA helicase
LDRLVLQLKATEALALSQQAADMTSSTYAEYLSACANSGAGSAVRSSASYHNCWSILSNCIDPPEDVSVQTSLQRLQTLQAITQGTETLTPLGKHLSNLPTDPKMGRLLVYGVLLGCVFDCSVVAALSGVKSPFVTSSDVATRAAVDQAKVL